ncbi:MAG: GMC family oxidoreductase, partial [Xanthomonadales bacterium]|nr:GMC family oxidoreductase [Xanthomonadales bacterium]
IVHDFYENDPTRGFYGGGGIDARPYLDATPIMHALMGIPPDVPTWGRAFKEFLRTSFAHKTTLLASTTSIPVERNNISLDPELKDDKGRPAIRLTYRDHADDLATARFLQERSLEILDAAGARRVWAQDVLPATLQAHLLGTCRMGDDPNTSVVDRYHRSHEVPNLFICDGSSFVSSGRGQPTMTIQALAFRAAEHIADFARRGEI